LAAQDHVVDRTRDVVVVRARAQERHVRLRVSVSGRQGGHVSDQVRLGERRCQTKRPREPGLGRDLDQQLLERARADHAEHLLVLVRRVGDVARGHQWPPCAISSSYCCAVRSRSHSPLLEGLTTSIQPLPYGSWLTISGFCASSPLTSTTSPETGAKRSDTALTDSTTPKFLLAVTFAPTFGSSTNTTSPSCSWAYAVIPTRTRSPSCFAHSCSRVYFSSLGITLAIA